MAAERAHAAYRLLAEVARKAEGMGGEEALLLAHYRRLLDLPAEAEPGAPAEGSELALWRDAPVEERRALVRTLVRVAVVDGGMHRRERRLLERAAAELGVLDYEFRTLCAEAEHALDRERRAERRGRLYAAALLVVAAGLAAGVTIALGPGPGGTARAAEKAFQDVEQAARPALLMIQVDYELERDGEKRRRRGTGTGFFVNAEGVVATNKHVLQPWKFDGELARLLADGWSFVQGSDRVVAYPVGARLYDAGGARTLAGAFDEVKGTLRVLGAPEDVTERRAVERSDGARVERELHAAGNADLALLQVFGPGPFRPLRLRPPSTHPAPLESVLVLGFPEGGGSEDGRARPTAARGEVAKVEDTFLVQAPLLGGSSGGPVLDLDGRVVGIATRTLGGPAYGRCIAADHVRALCAELGVRPGS